MNRVEISGRLVRDPEVREVGQGERKFPIATLNVAVDDGFSRFNRQTQIREVGAGFYRVEVPGAYGEALAGQLRKGDEVYVVGSLSQFTLQGKDGNRGETKTQIRALMVTPLVGELAVPVVAAPVQDFGEEPF